MRNRNFRFIFSYGDRGGDVQTEGSPRGEGFLAGVCGEWEQAAGLAAGGGVRTVNLRFPAVLHPSGGVMAMMLPVFRMYMGGPLGGGRQCMSWVTLEDAIEAVKHLLYSEEIAGPVNICSPQPVSNAEFTCQLARAIRRPVVFRVPKWALRLAVGEMSREVLLASCHAAPKMLTESGFTFRYPDLADAFAAWQRSGLL